MLKLCENISELSFLPADPFCAKITALAMTYGFDMPHARFYTQGNSAAISAADSCAVIYADESADFEEIKSFIGFLGCPTVQSSAENLEKLSIKPDRGSYIVKYEGKEAVKPNNFTDEFELKAVYNLLKSRNFSVGTYNSFAESICPRLCKGTALYGGIKEKELEACAFRLFDGQKSVLMGAVATAKEHEGKGLASSLVPYLASGGKETFLFCREDSLLEFYKKIGFSPWGRWAESDEVFI